MIQAAYSCHRNDTMECLVIRLHWSEVKAPQRREGRAHPKNESWDNLIRRLGTRQGVASTKADIIT